MKRILLSLLLALTASSCAVYAPKSALIPHLERQGDLQAAAAVNASTGATLSAAGAAGNHVGLQLAADFSMPDHRGTEEQTTDQYSLRPAAGYFHAFPCHLTLGAYAGAELAWSQYLIHHDPGRQENWTNYREYRNYRTTSLFGQADLTWAPAPWVDLALRLTLGNLHYDARTTFTTPDRAPSHLEGNSLLLEPSLQVRLGGPGLKLMLSASYAHLPQFPQESNLYFRPFTLGLGLSYRFNPFHR